MEFYRVGVGVTPWSQCKANKKLLGIAHENFW